MITKHDYPVTLKTDPDTQLPKLIGKGKAAAQFDISTRTLDRAILAGELVAVKIGARVLFNEQDLQAWIESKTIEAR